MGAWIDIKTTAKTHISGYICLQSNSVRAVRGGGTRQSHE